MSGKSRIPLLSLLAALAVLSSACSDDSGSPPSDAGTPCNGSDECPQGEVCRQGGCTEAPACADFFECGANENCADGLCAYDPDVCTGDENCDAGEICDVNLCREGCRIDRDCSAVETCNDDLVCERLPCTEAPCDRGFECIESTGACEPLPCSGGCVAPLQCREIDDRCVTCFDSAECPLGQSCNQDGDCVEDPCEGHEDCPPTTFCIDELCQFPPDCTDDAFEANDTYEDGTLIAEGMHTDLISCPYNDDFYKVVADGNHSLSVTLLFSHDEGNVDLEVFNTVGVLFARRISSDDDESVTVNIFKTGVYTVRVFQEAGTQGTPYDMEISVGNTIEVAPDLCVDDGFEPNDDADSATLIFSGRWTGMSICDDDQDYYLIPADGGELLEICVTPSEMADVSLGLEVLTGDEVVFLAGAGATMFCLEEDLLGGDDYLARVFATTEGEEAPYHISFDVSEGCRLFDDEYDGMGLNDRLPREDDDPLTELDQEDLPIELRICPNDSDYWPIPLEVGDLLVATIDFVNADGDLQLKLHRPDGSVRLGSSGRTDRETINYQAEETGTYFLRVYGEGEAMGAYTLDYSVTSP